MKTKEEEMRCTTLTHPRGGETRGEIEGCTTIVGGIRGYICGGGDS
jgi:hypothetical protein